MFRPRVVVLLLLLVLVLGLGFLLNSESLTGRDYLKSFFLQQLEQNLGRKIDVHRVKFVFFPRIRLELSQVAIHDRDPSQIFLTAKRIDLVLRFIPLLRKKVVGKRLLIEDPNLVLRRNQAGHWNVLDGSEHSASSDQEAVQMVSRAFRIREATLINGTVTIIDEARPDGVRTVKLETVEAALTIKADRSRADLHLSATHSGERGIAAVSLTGAVTKAEQPEALTAEIPSDPGLVFQFEGSLETANLNLREVADFFGPRPVPEQLRGTVNLHSLVRATPGVSGYDVLLSDIVANVEHLALNGRASLSGLLTPQPTFAVTFSSSPMAIEELLTKLPAEWVHLQLPSIIAERRINGTVEVATATLTGSSVTGPQLSLTGEFRVREGQALIGDDRVPAKNLSAVVFVEAGRIRVTKLTGLYGAIDVTEGKAMVSFLEAGPWLEMEITGNMGAADLMQFLAKTVKSEGLAKVLTGSRDVEGLALPTFRLVGPLNQPGGVTFAGGEIVAKHVSLTNALLPERLTGLQGRIIVSEGGVQFDSVTGHLGDVAVQVHGGITGGAGAAYQNVIVRARGDAAHMASMLPRRPVPDQTFEGILSAAAVVSGPTEAPHIRGDLVLTESRVALPGLVEKPVGAAASLEFEGDVASGGMSVSRLEVVLPMLRLPIKGKLHFGERFSIDAALATGTISLSSLPEWIAKSGFEAGNLEVSLDVKGKERDWKAWRITGWLALTNGLMTAKGVNGTVQDLYVRLKLVRNGAELKRLSFRMLDSDVTMDATIRNWMTKPVITAKIESGIMDIDLLIPKGERSPIREFLETLAATSRVTATASIERGHYKHLKFGSLSCRLTIQDGVLDVDRISGQSADGQIAGRLVVQLPPKAPAEADVSLRLTGLPFEDLIKLAKPRGQPITGQLRLTGSLRGHGRNPHGVFPSLDGKTELLLEQGRIFKSQERAVWKIMSLLNLPAVLQGKVDLEKEGLPYNKIAATVTVRSGLFETENLIIDSPIMKITAAGNYDLPTDQLDMVWAVSPFGSYSQFLKAIPLFGRLFAGDRKGIATALFAVKGSLDDPEVTYLPMKSFATGLTGLAQLAFDVLKNTLTLPIDLMTPEEDTSSPPGMDSAPAIEPRR